MAHELEPWRPPPTTSSPAWKNLSAQEVLSTTMSLTEAARAAKRLVGSYAHMKPGDPEVFVEAIAAVLSQYPLGLVHECVDPRVGIARSLKFLSIAELVEWLDGRLSFYRAMAWRERHPPPAERPVSPALPAPPFSEEHMAAMRQKYTALLERCRAAGDPIDNCVAHAREGRAAEAEDDRQSSAVS
jgi:hypothetical protein